MSLRGRKETNILKDGSLEVVGDPQVSEQGKFGWVLDPEGNKIELWEPPAGQ